MNIIDLIQKAANDLDEERKLQKENSGYMVQYWVCGHAREILWNEFELVAKAKEWCKTYLDAVIRPQSECPECKRRANVRHSW